MVNSEESWTPREFHVIHDQGSETFTKLFLSHSLKTKERQFFYIIFSIFLYLDSLNKDEIKGGGINAPNSKPETYMTKKTGMIILILTAILISFILIYVIYDCRKSIQKSNEKDQTNEENEQDEKLIK
jgi:hypothetical protein